MTELTPVPGAVTRFDPDGEPYVTVATCGTCGLSWNDAAVSSLTPTPAGRCPFEYEHEEEEPEVTIEERVARAIKVGTRWADNLDANAYDAQVRVKNEELARLLRARERDIRDLLDILTGGEDKYIRALRKRNG